MLRFRRLSWMSVDIFCHGPTRTHTDNIPDEIYTGLPAMAKLNRRSLQEQINAQVPEVPAAGFRSTCRPKPGTEAT
jgi:hypothetical protein